MPSVISYSGASPTTAQVQSYTFGGTLESGDKVRALAGTAGSGWKSVEFTSATTVINTFIDAIVAAWNALDANAYPEFAEVTASRSGSALVLTADDAGIPFTFTLTPLESDGSPADAQEIEGAGVATTGTTLTANSSPHDLSVAMNYSGGALPVNGDTLIIDREGAQLLYGLDALAGVTLAELRITAQDVTIGLPRDGDGYPEYRPQYLQVGATAALIRTRASRCKVDFVTVQTTAHVEGTGTGAERDIPAILLKGTHASNVWNLVSGEVGLGFFSEASTAGTLRVNANARVTCGFGVTLTAVENHGGELEINSAVGTSLLANGGRTTINGTGAVTGLTIRGGTVVYNTSGTLGGNPVVSNGGLLDFSQDTRPKAVTTIEAYTYPAVNDPFKVVSALVIDFNEAVFAPLGTHVRITRGAPA